MDVWVWSCCLRAEPVGTPLGRSGRRYEGEAGGVVRVVPVATFLVLVASKGLGFFEEDKMIPLLALLPLAVLVDKLNAVDSASVLEPTAFPLPLLAASPPLPTSEPS